ncbi:MAG TPA: DUF58 domain-containing protein [Balneolales bacterium]|nr:DUF58 domain-containing protein [Balneolales bacterium]
MLITPEVLTRLDTLELRARQIVEGFITGLHKSPHHGFSVEFAEHRPYNPGDEIRHIDWKAYAKSERYYVKQYEEETNLRSYIMLDISPSMLFKYYGKWNKLQYAVHFAASLMYLMHKQRDACGLVPFDQELKQIYPAKSSYPHLQFLFHQMEQYLEWDAKKAEKRRTASADVMHELAERLHQRSLVIILSDLFENVQQQDALFSALKHLRHRKHEVILFNLLEKRTERELDLPDHKFVFSDLETGSSIDVLPVQIRKEYRNKIEEYIRRFRILCSEAHIDFEEIDTEGSFDLALLAYLNKRRKLS